jgi:hypothetical protein
VKLKVLALTLLVAGAAFGQLFVGIKIGRPPRARVVVQTPSPGEGYSWIGGYWYPVGGHYRWHDGYWTRPAYVGAHWVEPHHDGKLYYDGYWDGDHGKFAHDHAWDKDHDHRDFGRHDH